MRVKVKVKHVPLNQVEYFLNEALSEALADLDSAHREIERLFQENKDLLVREGHLKDELAQVKRDASHAAFATGEILLEADRKAHEQEALIAELNDQITASESDAAFWKKAAEENSEIASDALKDAADWEASAHEAASAIVEMQATIDRLEAQIVAMGKKNDSITSEMAWWKAKAEEATAELVQYDVGKYKREIEEWQMTANTLSDRVRELQAEFAELQIEHQELGEDYDALVKTKCDYAEEIDRLRKVVINLQTNRFTYEEVIKMIMNHIVPSTDQ